MEIKVNKEKMIDVLIEFGIDRGQAKDLANHIENQNIVELLEFEFENSEVKEISVQEVVTDDIQA